MATGSPYPSTPPPAPVYVPLELYVADRERDARQRAAERAEDREWLRSIGRDVKRLVADLEQRTGAAASDTRHEGEDAHEAETRSGRRWAVWLAAITAVITSGAHWLVDLFRAG